ncbi:MAG TPA: chorismate-binding protein [Fimbriiglobus sp.]
MARHRIEKDVVPRRLGTTYKNFSGNMDTCIALRTMVLRGTTADIQAGAGLVADSDPAEEYQETVNKAQGLLTALAVAEGQL